METTTQETLNPVFVTELKTLGDDQTVQVRLEQIYEREIIDTSSLLSFTMKGHSAFNSKPPKRVAFQNFSKEQVAALGLRVGQPLPLPPGDAKLVVTETLTPRTWFDKETGDLRTQSPKTAGKDGEALTLNGKPIYRNTSLAIKGMPFADTFIMHDNVVVGSSTRMVADHQEVADPAESFEREIPAVGSIAI